MERNENGVPVTPNSGARNALDDFFRNRPENENTERRDGCRNAERTQDGCRNPQNGGTGMDVMGDSLPLAYAYVPWQSWRMLYEPHTALKNGTLFEELNKPLGVYGNE